jgi:hypothetical protein
MSRFMLCLDGHSRLRDNAMRLFASKPRLFSELLKIHVGAGIRPILDVRALSALAWQVLGGGRNSTASQDSLKARINLKPHGPQETRGWLQ